MAARCLAERSTLLSVLTIESLDKTIWNGDPNRGALATRLRENIPQTASKPPLFIGRGGADGQLWPLRQVLDRVRRTDDFKFNVNLVLIDLFLREGLVDPAGSEGRRLRAALDAP